MRCPWSCHSISELFCEANKSNAANVGVETVIDKSGMSFPLSHFVKFWKSQSQDIKGYDFSSRPLEDEVLEYLACLNPAVSTFDDCQKWVRA